MQVPEPGVLGWLQGRAQYRDLWVWTSPLKQEDLSWGRWSRWGPSAVQDCGDSRRLGESLEHAHGAAAFATDLDVDMKNSGEKLCP